MKGCVQRNLVYGRRDVKRDSNPRSLVSRPALNPLSYRGPLAVRTKDVYYTYKKKEKTCLPSMHTGQPVFRLTEQRQRKYLGK